VNWREVFISRRGAVVVVIGIENVMALAFRSLIETKKHDATGTEMERSYFFENANTAGVSRCSPFLKAIAVLAWPFFQKNRNFD
jgi:hypothetical protein